MTRKQFAENKDGVHLVSPLNEEFTLCGDALEGSASDEQEIDPALITKSRTVTCPKCATTVLHCRGVVVGVVVKRGQIHDTD